MAEDPNLALEEEEDEFGIDQKRMPFTDHLAELRNRLLVCVVTVLVSFVLFFFVFGRQIFDIMMVPLVWACRSVEPPVDPAQIKVARTPVSMFLTSAGVSLIAAVAVAIPVTLYELWMFVAPGLKKKERQVVFPVLTFGTVFFALGAVFAYTVVLRFVLRFLLKYTLGYKVAALWNVGAIVKFEAILMLVFGLAFEMPLVIVGMTRVGIVTPQALAKKRRYIIVLMFVVGALLTPPDVVSQVCLAVPMLVLFELSILAARFFKARGKSRWEEWDAMMAAEERKRRAQQAAAQADFSPDEPAEEYTEEDAYLDHYGDEDIAEAETYGEVIEEEPTEPAPEEEPGEGPTGEAPSEEKPDEEQPEKPEDEGDEKPRYDISPWDDDLPPDCLMH